MSSNRQQNPFEEALDSNPFDPPASSSSSDPFQHPNDSTFFRDSSDTERGVNTFDAPTSSSRGEPLDAADLAKQAEALRLREAAVAERERAYPQLRLNNWPPYFPFVHHDIGTLPSQHQTIMKLLYTQWLALVVTLIVNLLGCIFLLIGGASEGGADVASGAGYVPIIAAASFISWYRPIYLGFERTEGKAMAFFFYLYFLFAGFHLLFSIYMVIGIPSTGSAGLINTISSLATGHILAGVFGVLASLGWVVQAAGGGILYKRVWDYKNGHGDINFQEATNQFKASSIRTIILHQSKM